MLLPIPGEQLPPLFVTALSIPVLGERVGVRRWAAVGVGFLGVLVILRPVGAGFLWVMLLPVLAALCWSMVLIVTRLMRLSEAPLTVLFYSSVVGWRWGTAPWPGCRGERRATRTGSC